MEANLISELKLKNGQQYTIADRDARTLIQELLSLVNANGSNSIIQIAYKGTSFPTTAKVGEYYWDTNAKKLYQYIDLLQLWQQRMDVLDKFYKHGDKIYIHDGSDLVPISSVLGKEILVLDNLPSSPKQGTIYIVEGNAYYYTDTGKVTLITDGSIESFIEEYFRNHITNTDSKVIYIKYYGSVTPTSSEAERGTAWHNAMTNKIHLYSERTLSYETAGKNPDPNILYVYYNNGNPVLKTYTDGAWQTISKQVYYVRHWNTTQSTVHNGEYFWNLEDCLMRMKVGGSWKTFEIPDGTLLVNASDINNPKLYVFDEDNTVPIFTGDDCEFTQTWKDRIKALEKYRIINVKYWREAVPGIGYVNDICWDTTSNSLKVKTSTGWTNYTPEEGENLDDFLYFYNNSLTPALYKKHGNSMINILSSVSENKGLYICKFWTVEDEPIADITDLYGIPLPSNVTKGDYWMLYSSSAGTYTLSIADKDNAISENGDWTAVNIDSESLYLDNSDQNSPKLYKPSGTSLHWNMALIGSGGSGGTSITVKLSWNEADNNDVVSKGAINSQFSAIRRDISDISDGGSNSSISNNIITGTYTGKVYIPKPEDFNENKVNSYFNPGDFIISKTPEDITIEDVKYYKIDESEYETGEVVKASDYLTPADSYNETTATDNYTLFINLLTEHPNCKVIDLEDKMYPIKTRDNQLNYNVYHPIWYAGNHYGDARQAELNAFNKNGNISEPYVICFDHPIKIVGDVDAEGKPLGGFYNWRSALFYTRYSLVMENVKLVCDCIPSVDGTGDGIPDGGRGYTVFVDLREGIDHLIVRNCDISSPNNHGRKAHKFHVFRPNSIYVKDTVSTNGYNLVNSRINEFEIKTDLDYINHILFEGNRCEGPMFTVGWARIKISDDDESNDYPDESIGGSLITKSCRFINNTLYKIGALIGIGIGSGNEGGDWDRFGRKHLKDLNGKNRYLDHNSKPSTTAPTAPLTNATASFANCPIYIVGNKFYDRSENRDDINFIITSSTYPYMAATVVESNRLYFLHNEVYDFLAISKRPLQHKPVYDVYFQGREIFFCNNKVENLLRLMGDPDTSGTCKAKGTVTPWEFDPCVWTGTGEIDTTNPQRALPFTRYYTHNKFMLDENIVKTALEDTLDSNTLLRNFFYQYVIDGKNAVFIDNYISNADQQPTKVLNTYYYNTDTKELYKCKSSGDTTIWSVEPWDSSNTYYIDARNEENATIYVYNNGNLDNVTMDVIDAYNETFNIDEWLSLRLGVYYSSTGKSEVQKEYTSKYGRFCFNFNYIDYPSVDGSSSKNQYHVRVCEMIGNFFKTKYVPTDQYKDPYRLLYKTGNEIYSYLIPLRYTEILRIIDNVFTSQSSLLDGEWTIHAASCRYDSPWPDTPSLICEVRDNTLSTNSSIGIYAATIPGNDISKIEPYISDNGGGRRITVEEAADYVNDTLLYPQIETADLIEPERIRYTRCTIDDIAGYYNENGDSEPEKPVIQDVNTGYYWKCTSKGAKCGVGLVISNGNTFLGYFPITIEQGDAITIRRADGKLIRACSLNSGQTYNTAALFRTAVHQGFGNDGTFDSSVSSTINVKSAGGLSISSDPALVDTTYFRNIVVDFGSLIIKDKNNNTIENLSTYIYLSTGQFFGGYGYFAGQDATWSQVSNNVSDYSHGPIQDVGGLCIDKLGIRFLDDNTREVYECKNIGSKCEVSIKVYGKQINNSSKVILVNDDSDDYNFEIRTTGGKLINRCKINNGSYTVEEFTEAAVAAFREYYHSLDTTYVDDENYTNSSDSVAYSEAYDSTEQSLIIHVYSIGGVHIEGGPFAVECKTRNISTTGDYYDINSQIKCSDANILTRGVDAVWARVPSEGVGNENTSSKNVEDYSKINTLNIIERIGNIESKLNSLVEKILLLTVDHTASTSSPNKKYSLWFDTEGQYFHGLMSSHRNENEFKVLVDPTLNTTGTRDLGYVPLANFLEEIDKLFTEPTNKQAGDFWLSYNNNKIEGLYYDGTDTKILGVN